MTENLATFIDNRKFEFFTLHSSVFIGKFAKTIFAYFFQFYKKVGNGISNYSVISSQDNYVLLHFYEKFFSELFYCWQYCLIASLIVR